MIQSCRKRSHSQEKRKVIANGVKYNASRVVEVVQTLVLGHISKVMRTRES